MTACQFITEESTHVVTSDTPQAQVIIQDEITHIVMSREDTANIVINETGGTIITELVQGPAGPAGADGTGNGGGSSFLAAPDEIDDTDAAYFYWGWETVNGGWLVRRTLRSTAAKTNATITNNSGIATLATAWTTREALNYS